MPTIKKRLPAIFSLLFVLPMIFLSCAPPPRIPVAGKASGQDMLTLLPEDTRAFLVADWNRLINLKAVQKTLGEEKELEAYRKKAEAFVNLTKDVFLVAVAVAGDMNRPAENAVFLVNLKYDRSKLIPAESQQESSLEYYEGIPFFPFIEIEESAVGCLAFLDDSNLAIGSEKAVKKIIEVYKGKIPNLLASKEKRPFLKDLNMKAMTFGWLSLPAGLFKNEQGGNPAFKLMEKVRYISSFTDYRQPSYTAEIKIYADSKDSHQKIAETLSGLKALGLGLSGEAPEVGQALNSLEITSGERYVKLYLSLNEDLIEGLKKLLKERMTGDRPVKTEKTQP
ncbi:MAG: hypothetical protein N3G18_03820 [Candidatus Saccharicenans sp.]|nr:hypothetical protein [Candidatus Saccharicenans sp.]